MPYLSDVDIDVAPKLPLTGVVYGRGLRPFVCAAVGRAESLVRAPSRRALKNVFFLVDTGSPVTFLSPACLVALGYTDVVPTEMLVNISGIPLCAGISRAHFTDVCVLGGDFFLAARAAVTVKYDSKMVVIALEEAEDKPKDDATVVERAHLPG